MFAVAPKQVESTMIPKKGRKNKEIALEHFEKSLERIETSVASIEAVIKLQDPTVVEMRKNLRNSLREVKEAKKFLIKYKNIQYKPKRTRECHSTGLEKLRPISESMALFADLEYGTTQKSRYDVTNILCSYIKENDLRDPDNRTIIIPDNKLKELLQVEDGVVLKYPTMQKYLKNCFEEVAEESNGVVEEKEPKKGRKTTKETKAEEEPKPTTKKQSKKEAASTTTKAKPAKKK
jgi:chromatin remodeling complex protein RSC6